MRLLSIVALALGLLVARAGPVLAGREWCETDPILAFENGTRVQWIASFEPAGLSSLTGPVTYWIEVPSNVGAITVTLPVSAVPERVTVAYTGRKWDGKGAIPVRATITISAAAAFAANASVRGNVADDSSVWGSSNAPMTMSSAVTAEGWSPLAPVSAVAVTRTVTNTTTVYAP